MKKLDEFEPIRYKFADLVKICDGDRTMMHILTTAHILSEIIEWHNLNKGDWFCKITKEFAQEMRVSVRTISRHSKILRDKSLISIEIRMHPTRIFRGVRIYNSQYRLNVDVLKAKLIELSNDR